MNFKIVKELYNDDWINHLCDLILTDNSILNTNKNMEHILNALLHAIEKQISINTFKIDDYRDAYMFVSDLLEQQVEIKYTKSGEM